MEVCRFPPFGPFGYQNLNNRLSPDTQPLGRGFRFLFSDRFLDAAQKLYGGDLRSLAFGVKNAAFFGLALMLAAKDLGLDCHPMDGFEHDGVVEEFSIPKNFFVPMLIAVGHFDQSRKLPPRNWRKPYDEIVISTL